MAGCFSASPVRFPYRCARVPSTKTKWLQFSRHLQVDFITRQRKLHGFRHDSFWNRVRFRCWGLCCFSWEGTNQFHVTLDQTGMTLPSEVATWSFYRSLNRQTVLKCFYDQQRDSALNFNNSLGLGSFLQVFTDKLFKIINKNKKVCIIVPKGKG